MASRIIEYFNSNQEYWHLTASVQVNIFVDAMRKLI